VYVCMYVCMSSCEITFSSVLEPIRILSTNFGTNRIHNRHSDGIPLSHEDKLLFSCRSSAVNTPKIRKGTETPSYHTVSFMSWTNVTCIYRQNTPREPVTFLILLSPHNNFAVPVTAVRRRCAVARLLALWVRIPPGTWMFISINCYVL
jgi:hypothetical protein